MSPEEGLYTTTLACAWAGLTTPAHSMTSSLLRGTISIVITPRSPQQGHVLWVFPLMRLSFVVVVARSSGPFGNIEHDTCPSKSIRLIFGMYIVMRKVHKVEQVPRLIHWMKGLCGVVIIFWIGKACPLIAKGCNVWWSVKYHVPFTWGYRKN